MAKLRAVLRQLEAQKDHFDYAPRDESVVPTYSATKLAPGADTAAAPDAQAPVPVGPPLARGKRMGVGGAALPIDGELKALGVDTGPVGVGVRDKSVVFSLKF